MISVLIFLLFGSQNSSAQALDPMCGMRVSRWANQTLLKMTEDREHPFANACAPFDYDQGQYLCAKSNKERFPFAETFGVFQTTLPRQTLGGRSNRDFFKSVRAKIQKRIKAERKKIVDAQYCLSSKSITQCLPVPAETKTLLGIEGASAYNINNLIDDARLNLYLSYPSGINRINKEVTLANWDLRNNGIHKAKNWSALNRDEKKFAEDVFAQYKSGAKECAKDQLAEAKKYNEDPAVRKKYEDAYQSEQERLALQDKTATEEVPLGCYSNASFSRFMGKVGSEISDIFTTDEMHRGVPVNNLRILEEECLRNQRNIHTAAYTAIMANNPILQFIQNPNPNKSEVSQAVSSMLESLEKEEKWLAETTESLDSYGELDTDLLKIMNYRTEVAKTLSEQPDYCGISRDFVNLAEAKSLGVDMALTLPVVAASFFMPISAAVLVDTISMGAMVGKDQIALNESKYQVYGRFNPNSQDELNRASQIELMRNMDAFFTGIAAAPLPVRSFRNKYRTHSPEAAKGAPALQGNDYIEGEYIVISKTQGSLPRPAPRRITRDPNP